MSADKTIPIVALRNEKGSYSKSLDTILDKSIVALRNEKGSYSEIRIVERSAMIVALRNEKGSYSYLIKRII